MTSGKVLFFLFFLFTYSLSYAQKREKCGTVLYNKSIKNKLGINEEEFEKWLQNKIAVRKLQQATSRTNEEVQVIPIVIHVIHNGEALGTGVNIPLSQITEQLKTLNEDFRKKNKDTTKTPSLFKSLSADCYVEFKLAIQDPDGAPTTGVVRINGKKTGWRFEDGDDLKKVSYWPSDKYLNVWVANMTDNTIGFSQFPTSNTLPGLEEGSDIAETDGVVIHYKELGMGGNANNRSRGRTLTHEIGHFFGLKHVWGDDGNGCGGSDYVNDTPNQAAEHNSCPGFPSPSCNNTSDMFMNYMDYTPDTCMNIFTMGQKERMKAIIENSPRRNSLLTSFGLTAPIQRSRDAAVTKILSPGAVLCGTSIIPEFILRNLGTTKLTSVVIDYKINDVSNSITKTVSVNSYDTTKITLPELTVPSVQGNYTLSIEVKSPNGGTDERANNNILTHTLHIPPSTSLPFKDNLNDLSIFSVTNSSGNESFEIKDAGGNGTSNKAARINFLNSTQYGEKYYLVSPTFNTLDIDSLSLSFKYSYAPTDLSSNDQLVIRLSLNCGEDFLSENELFNGNSLTLKTTDATFSPFSPTQANHWKTVCLNLENYIGFNNMQIQFEAIYGGGNALFIDDVALEYSTCNGGSPVGTENTIPEETVNIFPNPTDGKAYIDLSLKSKQDFEITVFDILGREISRKIFIKEDSLHETLDLEHQSSGLYFIKIHGKTINLNRRLILEK